MYGWKLLQVGSLFWAASIVIEVGLDAPLRFRWIFCVRVQVPILAFHPASMAYVAASLCRGGVAWGVAAEGVAAGGVASGG